MTIQTGLDYLRSRGSIVDCDTMDEEVAEVLGPFQDCTSNQAIAYNELRKSKHAELLMSALTKAHSLISEYPDLTVIELAIEIAMVALSLRMVPHITGRIHIQTNPYYSYSTGKTIANAIRLVKLASILCPSHPQSRISIKIPSTWEGLMACQYLEKAGIRTLATTLFTLPQAMLAAEVGCTYVAPYVNQLRVHFEEDFKDPSPALPLVPLIQEYYTRESIKTQVLPASLTSTEEIFFLAGAHHITIPPKLLDELSKPLEDGFSAASLFKSPGFDDFAGTRKPTSFVNDESGYRLAVARDAKGKSEEKLAQAVNIFCDMQDKLVSLFQQSK
ncbi:transaldolase family protein [Aspergillus ibericus CBS 121593]|uniref:Transaldolase n=1 Tax=Aspergillus ibericus CBS 121593 TaxID=1448316 RepID=A0A395GY25_9EURO|nr:transaldolase [Aspergillus ibericus CBS 121593]RAK98953.1 transaldolase [Aspergillus ibericus CBS 121593]